MRTRTVLSVTAAMLISGALAVPVATYASQLSDAQGKAGQLAHQQQQTQQKITALKQQENKLSAQISQLQTQVDSLQKSIVVTQADILRRDAQIAQLKKEIEATQRQIEQQYQVLNDRVRVMYEAGQTSYLDVLFSSSSFSDLLDNLQLMAMVAQQDKQVLEHIRSDKAALDSKQTSLKGQLAQVQVAYQNLVSQKQKQETAQQTEKSLLGQVHNARLSQESELRSENSAMQNLQSLISQLQAQEGDYSGPASGWTWPVPGHTTISSGYGYRSWSDGSREFHNGIDIPAPIGTPMVAATSGKVLYAGPASGFGDWIVIESAGGLIEIYGHMYAYQIKVHPGQVVHTGQQIASVGNNGFSTGAHLHFTVAKGFDSSGFPISVNPLSYLK